jgi:pilus assembly protein Flp/PilA
MDKQLRCFLSDQSAVTAIEYALLGGLISVVVIISVSFAGVQTQQLWEHIKNRVVEGLS